MKYYLLGNEGKVNVPHLILACWYDCNLNCAHCYNSLMDNIVSLEKWKAVIAKWISYTGKNGIVHFKGGEPLLPKFHQNLVPMVNLVKERGLSLFFTTNGTTLTEPATREIALQTDMMIVSLNGHTSEADELREKGTFEKTVQGIELLRQENVPFAINYVVYGGENGFHGNEKHIFEMVKFTKELGAEQLNLLPLVKRGDALKQELKMPNFEIVLGQLEQVMNNGLAELVEWSVLDLIQKIAKGENRCEGCVGGYKDLAYITPDGKVYSCPNTVFEEYKLGTVDDILEKGFEVIFQSEEAEKLRKLCGENLVCRVEMLSYTDNQQTSELKELEQVEAVCKGKIDEQNLAAGTEPAPIAVCFNRNW